MAAAGAFMMALGPFVQTAGILNQGEQRYQASDYNARVAESNANAARAQASEEERRARVQSRKELGRARAGYSASGVTLEGSPLDVLEESASNAELDALAIRHQGELKARAFEADATLERYRGKSAKKNAQLAAYGTLLGGAGNIAGSYAGGG